MSAQDNDTEFLKSYCEENFYQKLKKRMDEINKEGLRLRVKEDVYINNGKPLEVEACLYDHMVIKGLSMDRKKNGTVDDYVINNDIERMGFISHVTKHQMYDSNPNGFFNPNNKDVFHEDATNIIFRAYCQFTTGYKLHLIDQEGNDLIEYPAPEEYTN